MNRHRIAIYLLTFVILCPIPALFADQTAREAAARQGIAVPLVEHTEGMAQDMAILRERLRNLWLNPINDIDGILQEWQEDGTFRSVDYQNANRSQWLTIRHLDFTLQLARAWANPKSPHFHDKRTAHCLTTAFAWWMKHKPHNPNWWWNEIGLPTRLLKILLLVPELISANDRQTALELCRKISLRNYTGQNLVDGALLVLQRGLVEDDASVVTAGIRTIQSEIRLSPPVGTLGALEGIRADGCYHQHGPQIQFGGYGLGFLNNIANLTELWKDTGWTLDEEQWGILRHLIFDGYQWVLWNGRMDLLVGGRHMRGDTGNAKGLSVLAALRKYRALDPLGAEHYNQVIQRNTPGHPNDLVGNRWFWNSDLMVHRRPKWMAVMRACSTRVHPMEDNINQDCALGRYFADGTCLIYRHGEEYVEMPAVWDWTRLPGTTLPATPVSATKKQRFTLSANGFRMRGMTSFVGGVTDGQHGCAIYTQNLDNVAAKKAYFFDDNAIYELGVDICSTSPNPVATTINSCRLNGEIRQGDGWVWHDGVGYVGAGLAVTSGDRTGDERILFGGLSEPTLKTLPVFHLQIDHGLLPQNAMYSVAILPDATAEETAAFRLTAVVANTPKLQAARFADGTVAAIFHAPGTLDGFTTDSPGIFLLHENMVFVADPTQQLKTITVTYRDVVRCIDLPDDDLAGTTTVLVF